jgi:hypothetical protein
MRKVFSSRIPICLAAMRLAIEEFRAGRDAIR